MDCKSNHSLADKNFLATPSVLDFHCCKNCKKLARSRSLESARLVMECLLWKSSIILEVCPNSLIVASTQLLSCPGLLDRCALYAYESRKLKQTAVLVSYIIVVEHLNDLFVG